MVIMAIRKERSKTGKKYKKRAETPQQLAFVAYYNDPQSETFGNALQSALKAGFSRSYAENITVQSPAWMTDDVKRASMVKKAESNMQAILDKAPNLAETNPSIYKVWQDSNKFVLETLGKDQYSKRQELTGKGGKQLFNTEHQQLAESALAQLLDDDN